MSMRSWASRLRSGGRFPTRKRCRWWRRRRGGRRRDEGDEAPGVLRGPGVEQKDEDMAGHLPQPEMAASAHDAAALALHGASTCLNFPDSASYMPVPESGSPWDIRRSAANAADAFRPPEDTKMEEKDGQHLASAEVGPGVANGSTLQEQAEVGPLESSVLCGKWAPLG